MLQRRLTRAQKRRHLEAADWILRNREAGRTAADEAAFRQWLDRDPENADAYEAAMRLMGEARMAMESDPALRDLRIKPRSVVKPILGSLLALFVAGSLFLLFDGPMRLQADVIAGTAEMPVVALEDGSTVQLNASSAIAHDFDATHRTVRLLRGQAFFEVAGDPDRPFTVEAGDVRVTALGTAFDVRLGGTETDVTVTHNAVLVEFASSANNSLRLKEGEQAGYDHATHARTAGRADTELALSWRRGLLVVDNAPLSYVVEEMSRHFSGRIVIADNQLARRRVSGTMTVSDTGAALAFLERALGVRINRIGPVIVIRN
ncbi:iron dicitrate transporter FecR [Mesorhizobium sp. L-8-10]|nr:iron dicitrate transporter FecR [Mesorhizobium sp. L-8-10]